MTLVLLFFFLPRYENTSFFFLRNEEYKISNSLWNWKARNKRKEKYILFIFRLRSYRLLPFPRPEPVSQLTLICRGYTGWICRESCGKKRQPGTGALDTDYQANKAPPQPEEEGSAQEQRLIAISNTLILYLHDPPSLPAPEYPHNTSHSDIDRVGRELRSKRASDHISKKLIPSCTPIPDKFEVNQTSELNQFSLNLHSRMKGSIQQRITSCDEKSLISISLFLSLSRRRRRNVSSLFLSLSRVGSHVLELM